MKFAAAIAAVALTLGIASASAHAQSYVVNGQAASPAEAQYLASHGFRPGHWSVDAFGISHVDDAAPAPVRTAARKCWFVLDVELCN